MPLPEILPRAIGTKEYTRDTESASISYSHDILTTVGVTERSWSENFKASDSSVGSTTNFRNDERAHHDGIGGPSEDNKDATKHFTSLISIETDSQTASVDRTETSAADLSTIYDPREIQGRLPLPSSMPPRMLPEMSKAKLVGLDPRRREAMTASPSFQRSWNFLWNRNGQIVKTSESQSVVDAPHLSEAAIQTRHRFQNVVGNGGQVVNKRVTIREESSSSPCNEDKTVMTSQYLKPTDEATVETYENGESTITETTEMIRSGNSWFPCFDWAFDSFDPIENNLRFHSNGTTAESDVGTMATELPSQKAETALIEVISQERFTKESSEHDDATELQQIPIYVKDRSRKVPDSQSRLLRTIPSILPKPMSNITKKSVRHPQHQEQRERIITFLKAEEEASMHYPEQEAQSIPVVTKTIKRNTLLPITTKSILKRKGSLHPRKGIPLDTSNLAEDALGENAVSSSDPVRGSTSSHRIPPKTTEQAVSESTTETPPGAGIKHVDETGNFDVSNTNSIQVVSGRSDYRSLRSMVTKAERKIKASRLIDNQTSGSSNVLKVTQQDLHFGKRKPWSMIQEKLMQRAMDKVGKKQLKAVEPIDTKNDDVSAFCGCFSQ